MSYTMFPSVSSGGRAYVPVKPSQFVYSQFRYVAGVPAKAGQEGVSVDKIKILNTLIDQLVSMRQKGVESKLSERGDMSEGQINALIQQYQDQVKTAIASSASLPYKPSMPAMGMIVNLSA
jgi:hypothetical protein